MQITDVNLRGDAFGLRFLFPLLPDQRLDLCKLNSSDSDAVRGQIVGKAGRTDVLSVQMTPPPSPRRLSVSLSSL